ncbi:MAG: PIG-L family deacetylase [Candidatus Marinimicrobia bacterium]|jgi:LmbE family N-acetylglucosaminyl deacetylase|nr:PIG-L family deacetylase [Candidatus Neomarinimicrobiota bacterium]MBT5759133.1 PIG-L family deacetylase [Candidatus Neomarinimicrobiota bacterium]MBT6471104.1 PIG-L family deacetylase [Candidatus Neomarinimicrobiota bacterium]
MTVLTSQQEKIRIICIGAHPDDCDVKFGGTAALFAEMGHMVKFVSVTNGDAGHQTEGGSALAKRRRAEAKEAGRRLGIKEYITLDNHDGELVPSLVVRNQIIREIRKWNADIVLSPRPNDYHPDHRYTGVLVQDASYLVIVPNIASDINPLTKNPLFLYLNDNFKRPNPFQPDIVVAIDKSIDKKINALDAHVSQMYEWIPWTMGEENTVPKGKTNRKKWLKDRWRGNSKISNEEGESLEKWYGGQSRKDVKYIEVFEVCEYGNRPTDKQILRLFPMLNKI